MARKIRYSQDRWRAEEVYTGVNPGIEVDVQVRKLGVTGFPRALLLPLGTIRGGQWTVPAVAGAELQVPFWRNCMTKLGFLVPLAAATLLLGQAPEKASAQGQFAVITGAQFDSAAPDSITLEGKKMPVEKRNAALVQSPGGTRAFLALVDASGYASDIATKYAGMVQATGGSLSIGGKTVAAGTYGFGWAVPPRGEEGPGKLTLYTQAGVKLAEVATQRDAELKTPMPLQVIVLKNGTARLYHGRHSVELR